MSFKISVKHLGSVIIVLAILFYNLYGFSTNKKKYDIMSLPNEYMQGINYTEYDEHGNKSSQILAKRWSYNKRWPYSITHDIEYISVKPQLKSWHLTSTKSHIYHPKDLTHIDKIEFMENVNLSLDNEFNQPITTIKTQEVEFFPNSSAIQGTNYVTLTKGNLVSSGKGLVGTLDDNKFEILSDVKTKIKFDSSN